MHIGTGILTSSQVLRVTILDLTLYQRDRLDRVPALPGSHTVS